LAELERYRWLIVALFTVPLLSGLMYFAAERLDGPDPIQVNAGGQPLAEVRVYVAGAVRNPGVYTLGEEDRWIDAVEAAGGFAPDANQVGVNLARRVQDEDQIVVPSLTTGVAAGASQGPLLNINTATEAQLMDLPGIGEVRAARIVESRAADGPFAAVDDLVSRGIVPQSVFEDIAALITTSQ
jgi:competence protein ComEA